MFSTEFLLKGVAAPAATAFAATLILSQLFAGRRAVAAVAFALAQTLGWFLTLESTAAWIPTRNLHWTPWLAVLGSLVGPIVVASGLATLERWLLAALATLGAAAFLVPNWPELWPSRPVSIAAVAFALAVIARGTDSVARKQSPRLVSASLSTTAIVAGALIAASLSFRLGEAALVSAAALGGVTAALWIVPSEEALRGLALLYAIAVGGWCYVAAIEPPPPDPPIWGLMCLPATPLVLWLTAIGPVSRMKPAVRWAMSIAVVLAWLGGIGVWTWFATEQAPDEYSQARLCPTARCPMI